MAYTPEGGLYGSAVTPMTAMSSPPSLVPSRSPFLMPPTNGVYAPDPFRTPLGGSEVRSGPELYTRPADLSQSWNPLFKGYGRPY